MLFFSKVYQLFFLAGTTVLLLFVVFSGTLENFPFTKFYWIEATTSSISGLPDVSRWTYWGLCKVKNDRSYDCDNDAAYPFSPVDNFGTTVNVPSDFVDNRDTYFYLSRAAFSLILAALIFSGVSFIVSIVAFCSKTMRTYLGFFVTLAIITDAAGMSCQTAAIVLGRNAFSDSSMKPKLGKTLLGLGWASLACLILCWFGLCCGSVKKSYQEHKANVAASKLADEHQLNEQEMAQNPYALPATAAAPGAIPAQSEGIQNQGTLLSNEGGIRFFKIRRNHKGDDQESV